MISLLIDCLYYICYMYSLSEIRKSLKIKKKQLVKQYPIESLAIFGSYARDEQTEESDLDIIVEFNGVVGSKFIQLADELEEAIGLKVDLVSKKGIKERYFNSIKSDLIYV